MHPGAVIECDDLEALIARDGIAHRARIRLGHEHADLYDLWRTLSKRNAEAGGKQDRKDENPEHRFRLAPELEKAHQYQLRKRIFADSPALAHDRHRCRCRAHVPSRRRRPVSETNTSSSVAECVRSSDNVAPRRSSSARIAGTARCSSATVNDQVP